MAALLRRPELDYADVLALTGETPAVAPEVAEQLAIQAKYAGYLDRQEDEIERARRHEALAIPDDLDFEQVSGLSNEIRQKLADHRPATVGQAARIQGVTPAAVSLLVVHIQRGEQTSHRRSA